MQMALRLKQTEKERGETGGNPGCGEGTWPLTGLAEERQGPGSGCWGRGSGRGLQAGPAPSSLRPVSGVFSFSGFVPWSSCSPGVWGTDALSAETHY